MSIDMWSAIENERLVLAGHLDQLVGPDWTQPTRCEAWDVKAVAAHLVLPFEVSKPRFMLTALRNKRDVRKTVDQLSAKVNEALSTEQIIQSLRTNAASQWKPPGTTAVVPLSEIVVHGQDIRRAVGMDHEVAPDVVAAMLAAIDDPSMRADYESRVALR